MHAAPPVHDDAGRSGIGGPLHSGLAGTTCSGDTHFPCRGTIHMELLVVAPDTGGTFAFIPLPTPKLVLRARKGGATSQQRAPSRARYNAANGTP